VQILKREPFISTLIVGLSVLVPLVVAYLLYQPQRFVFGDWVLFLPHLNGIINTATSLLLIAGFVFIKSGKQDYHKYSMISAFVLGIIFLVSYIIYHGSVPSTSYGNEGTIRYLYYFLLISHILLSIAVVPLVLLALLHALRRKFERHKKVVKYAFPVWLYVSVTGVLVYLMIKPFY
jgi:putative membrane protein